MVEAWVGQRQAERVLPVDPASHGPRGPRPPRGRTGSRRIAAPPPARAALVLPRAGRDGGRAPRTVPPGRRGRARRRCAGRACPWETPLVRSGVSPRAPWAGLAGAATWHRPPRGQGRIIGPHAQTRRHDREIAKPPNSPPASVLGQPQSLLRRT
jgi:hypothetical protein